MYNHGNDFYVCLLSNNSMNYYNGNTLSSFTNLLSTPCNLDGGWYVGVTEIAFNSYAIHNLEINHNKRYKRNATAAPLKPQTNLQNNNNNKPTMNDKLTPGNSFTPVMVIPQALSQIPEPVLSKLEPMQDEKHTNVNQSEMEIAVVDDANNSKQNTSLKQIFHPFYNEIDFVEVKPMVENKNNSKLPVLNFIYVYSEIIKPRYIGDIKSRYLKIIPKLDSKASIIKIDHVEYCPLEKSYIENISILILDDRGEKINFQSAMSPTYIMLHFKKN